VTLGQAEIYAGLRSRALGTKASDLGLGEFDGSAFGVVMVFSIKAAHASVVAFNNGEASIYLSTGGGFIGGGRHASVSLAAKNFVLAASRAVPGMKPVTDCPLPSAGMTNFYVLTADGAFFAEERDTELHNRSSSLTLVFAAGQGVITAYRTLPQRKA
jgi:hypothetical protein